MCYFLLLIGCYLHRAIHIVLRLVQQASIDAAVLQLYSHLATFRIVQQNNGNPHSPLTSD